MSGTSVWRFRLTPLTTEYVDTGIAASQLLGAPPAAKGVQ
jgi:hypothetical protein